jgi:hypothetical protein
MERNLKFLLEGQVLPEETIADPDAELPGSSPSTGSEGGISRNGGMMEKANRKNTLVEVRGRQYRLVPIIEDTVKVDGGYENIGKEGKHSEEPMSKKNADDQRKAMFANGYKEAQAKDAKASKEVKGKKIAVAGPKNDLKGGSKGPDEDIKMDNDRPGNPGSTGSRKPGYGPSKVGGPSKDPKDPPAKVRGKTPNKAKK